MATPPKRQQLLTRSPQQNKPQPSHNKPQTKQPAKQQAQTSARARQTATAVKQSRGILKKLVQLFFLALLIGLIVVPKPQLLIYKKLGTIGRSIYIPGWFGQPGRLLDSTQRVVIEENLGLIYLCFGDIDNKEQCNRYQFIEQRGIFAALNHYREFHYEADHSATTQ